ITRGIDHWSARHVYCEKENDSPTTQPPTCVALMPLGIPYLLAPDPKSFSGLHRGSQKKRNPAMDFSSSSALDVRPPWRWPRAAYIHVPFCAPHCGYCDFAVAVGHDDRIAEYIEALTSEMSSLGQPQPVQTLFLGGGTPTHLSAAQLGVLLE